MDWPVGPEKISTYDRPVAKVYNDPQPFRVSIVAYEGPQNRTDDTLLMKYVGIVSWVNVEGLLGKKPELDTRRF